MNWGFGSATLGQDLADGESGSRFAHDDILCNGTEHRWDQMGLVRPGRQWVDLEPRTHLSLLSGCFAGVAMLSIIRNGRQDSGWVKFQCYPSSTLLLCLKLSKVAATKWVQLVCCRARICDVLLCLVGRERRLRDPVVWKASVCDEPSRP